MIKVGDSSNTYTSGTSSSKSTTKSSSSSSDTNDQFMSLLLAQMTNQNPLEPMNDTEMVNQMVSMNSLNELQKISKSITSLTQTNEFVSASALMDKSVTYLDSDSKTVTGTVTGVSLKNSEVYLTVDDKSVALSSISSVANKTS